MSQKDSSQPLVSVVLTTYNRAKLLTERALPSVLRQTYPSWECIVVDDGSTDSTAELVKEIAKNEARVRYIRLETNRGLSPAANRGIREAKGEFLSFLDSDDEYLPNFLEELVPRLMALGSEYGGVAGGAVLIHPNGWRELVVPRLNSFYTAVGNGIWLLRTDIFSKGKLLFDEEMESEADSDLGIRFFEKYKAKVIDKTVTLKYTHPMSIGSMSSTPSPRRLRSLEKFLEKYLPKFEAKHNRRELARLYRFSGRNFCLGGEIVTGRKLLLKALTTRPTIQNFIHLVVAWGGHLTYRYYWQTELLLLRFLRRI